jgi:hypothetical protein
MLLWRPVLRKRGVSYVIDPDRCSGPRQHVDTGVALGLWPAVFLWPDRAAELLAVLTQTIAAAGFSRMARARRSWMKVHSAATPDDILRCQYRRHRLTLRRSRAGLRKLSVL